MVSKNTSVLITSILIKLMFLGLVAAAFFTPWFLRMYTAIRDSKEMYVPFLVVMYLSILLASVALCLLNRLITNIKRAVVFETVNVKTLRGLSYCCFAVAAIYAAFGAFCMGFFYIIAWIVAFAALFFGLILRVIKNVFEQAVSIKEENDYTI